MEADDYDLLELGVVVKGTFSAAGKPDGWTLALDVLDERLPRWLLREPVMTIENGSVYIRSMYSRQLSRELHGAKYKRRT